MAGEAQGNLVLEEAVRLARITCGPRLLAAYALGSLAHGGFSSLVSDVDLGLVLQDPLSEADGEGTAAVGAQVAQRELPLSDRLSVFWGSPLSLRGGGGAGRFPPLDRLDLIRHGRLLWGEDQRSGLPVPSHQDLVLAAAEMGLELLERPAYRNALADAGSLVRAGVRPLTKAVLFPVRFVFTARTGEIGRNHDAVEHFVATESGPEAALAAAALGWREQAPAKDDAGAIRLVGAGLRPIYRLFLVDYFQRIAGYGLQELASRLNNARQKLDDGR